MFFDIETAPNLVYTWGFWDQNVSLSQTKREAYVLCYSYKWLNEKKVHYDSIHLYPGFSNNVTDDKQIAISAWKLFDEADIIVAHNGDRFDIKWMNALFVKHDLGPPSTYRTIDTLKSSKYLLKSNSHSLGDQTIRYKLGAKIDTGGFELWAGCMEGNINAFKRMIKYCKHDVRLLERWYLKLRPFITNHPNVSTINYSETGRLSCPKCGSNKYSNNGFRYLSTGKYHRYKCGNCKSGFRDGANLIRGSKNLSRN